jgi:WD40 repeat protein
MPRSTPDISAKNTKTLHQLGMAIARSQGQFKLILIRCDYTSARSHWTQRLTDHCRAEHGLDVPVLSLPKTGTTLYSLVQQFLVDRHGQATHGVQVIGLEAADNIAALLANANQVRENLREFPFPLLVWLNDEVLQHFMFGASDLFSWATTKQFLMADVTLVEALAEIVRLFFDRLAVATDSQLLGRADVLKSRDRNEARTAQTELDRRDLTLDPVLRAQMDIIFGRESYRGGDRDAAETQLEASLVFWRGEGHEHSEAVVFAGWAEFYLALLALDRAEDDLAQLAIARERFAACETTFIRAGRSELLKQCRNCSAWQLLDARLEADRRHTDGDIDGAIAMLERLRGLSPSSFPKLYLSGLETLQGLYFDDRRDYLKAYKVRQDRNAIERRYGLRAFIGAGRLQPIETDRSDDDAETLPPEIEQAGRGDDVRNLLERIGRNDCKLIVLNGPSGVGKSSLVNAGLVPALQTQSVGYRDVTVAVVRVYRDWPRELAAALEIAEARELGDPLAAVRAMLRTTKERHGVTVFVLDQFEEFFFANPSLREHREFFRFVGSLLDNPELLGAVKVVLSLRDDYLHFLLVCNRMEEMRGVGQDVLSKNVLYPIGNLSDDQTEAVIRTLVVNTALRLDGDLLARFVGDLADDVGEIRPIELQIAGTQLQGRGISTLADYEALATGDESPKQVLVRGYLDEVVLACGGENERLANLVLYLLTDERGTRPLRTKDELRKDLEGLHTEPTEGVLDLVLEIFVLSGLLVLLPASPVDRYQLVHDYLAMLIRSTRGRDMQAMQRELGEERKKRVQAEARLETLEEQIAAAEVEYDAIREATHLEKFCRLALRQLSLHRQLEALVMATEAGKILQKRVGDAPLSEYPTVQPIHCLAKALQLCKIRNTISYSYPVYSANFSPDNKRIIAISLDGIIEFWDATTGELSLVLNGHSAPTHDVNFSPDGERIVSASQDGSIKLWNADSGEELLSLNGHSEGVNSVNFSPDGNRVVSASTDKTVKLWDARSGEALFTFNSHSGSVFSANFSPDGERVVSGSVDNTIKLWDGTTGEELLVLKGHSDRVYSVNFSSDGKRVVSASGDGTIKLWDASSGKALLSLDGHSASVRSANFSPNGKQIISASEDNTIKFWDVTTEEELLTLNGHSDWVYSVNFSSDGEQVVSASQDGTIKLWDVSRGEEIQIFNGHSDWVWNTNFSSDSKRVVSASRDGTIKLWNTSSSEALQTFNGHSAGVRSANFSPNNEQIISASEDNTVKLWDARSGEELKTLHSSSSAFFRANFSLDGERIVSVSFDGTVKLWDATTGEELRTLQCFSLGAWNANFSLDGEKVVSVFIDGNIKLWDANTGEELQTLNGHSGSVNSANFSPDGERIVSASADKTIKLWDVNTGEELQTLNGHSGSVNSANFSPDGERIVSASADKTIKLWDANTGEELQTLNGHSGSVNSANFSPDGKTIVSASSDNTVKLWKVETLDELIDRACDWLTPWLNNPNGGATDDQRAVCDLPPRTPTN